MTKVLIEYKGDKKSLLNTVLEWWLKYLLNTMLGW